MWMLHCSYKVIDGETLCCFLRSSSPQVTVIVGGQSNVIPGLVVSYSPPAISNLSTTLFSTAGMKSFCFPHDRREMHTHTCSS